MSKDIFVQDNFIEDQHLVMFLHEWMTLSVPHYFNQISNKDELKHNDTNQLVSSMFSQTIFKIRDRENIYGLDSSDLKIHDEPIIEFIFQKIKLLMKNNFNMNIAKIRTYSNIQHYNQEGNWHTDDGDVTAMLMISSTNKNNGAFEYKSESGEIKKVDFVQNRLVLFPTGIEHRGRAPFESMPRITLAYKTRLIN